MQFTEIFRGNVVDVSKRSVTVEVTGTDDKIEAFEQMVGPFGLIEMVRTGEIAVSRGRGDDLAARDLTWSWTPARASSWRSERVERLRSRWRARRSTARRARRVAVACRSTRGARPQRRGARRAAAGRPLLLLRAARTATATRSPASARRRWSRRAGPTASRRGRARRARSGAARWRTTCDDPPTARRRARSSWAASPSRPTAARRPSGRRSRPPRWCCPRSRSPAAAARRG